MKTLSRISSSLIFWRLMFFMAITMAFIIYVVRPRVVIKQETIYLIMEHESDSYAVETRTI